MGRYKRIGTAFGISGGGNLPTRADIAFIGVTEGSRCGKLNAGAGGIKFRSDVRTGSVSGGENNAVFGIGFIKADGLRFNSEGREGEKKNKSQEKGNYAFHKNVKSSFFVILIKR